MPVKEIISKYEPTNYRILFKLYWGILATKK